MKKNKRICIVARKNLARNTRIVRQARVLSEAGHEVTVLSMAPPSEELRKTTPDVTYMVVDDLNPVTRRLSRILNRAIGLVKKMANFLAKLTALSFYAVIALIFSPLLVPGGLIFLLLFKLQKPELTVKGLIEAIRAKGISALISEFLAPYSHVATNVEFAKQSAVAVKDMTFDQCQAHDTYALRAAENIIGGKDVELIYDAVEIPEDRSGWVMKGMPRFIRLLESRVERRIIDKADKILTVSEGLADWTEEHYAVERPLVIRNFRFYEDPAENPGLKQSLGLNSDNVLALFMNSLYAGQGLEQLAEAVRYMDEHIHVATLGPVAQKGFDEKLKARLRELNVEDRFHFLDPVDPSILLQTASGADFGVIPRQNTSLNNWFSLPNRILEMCMARLPLVCCSLKDMRDFVEEYELGLVFDETNPKDIARAVNEMAKPEVLARYRGNVDKAARELTWEREGQRYVDFVERV